MNIAILGSRGIPARYGGFETFAEQLAVGLVEHGHAVTVFCEATEGTGKQYKGVKLRHLRSPRLGSLSTLFFDAACLWQARSSFDVVYMLGYGPAPLCWIPRIWGSQVWINMDGLEWARGKWGLVARVYFRFAEAMAMRTPDRIIADAASIKTYLQARYRHLPPCDVIPYGCEIVSVANPEELKSFGLRPDSYYLLVCRFEPENHIKEILEGFLRSRTSKRLVLVGDSTRKTAYVTALGKYKDRRLLFTGPVYDAPKIQALRRFCSAYIHGHSVGGTNPSLLEAMGCGNVVIAHDNVFNREVLGNSAVFFSTTEGVSTAVDTLESGALNIAGMKAGVLERAKQFYTWDQIIDHYCELGVLVKSESRNRSEVIHCAPLLPDKRPGL